MIIKQITMTNTFNIAGADGNVLVPVLSETGSLMAYLLSADPTGILRELYCSMSTVRPLLEHSLTTVRPLPYETQCICLVNLVHQNIPRPVDLPGDIRFYNDIEPL